MPREKGKKRTMRKEGSGKRKGKRSKGNVSIQQGATPIKNIEYFEYVSEIALTSGAAGTNWAYYVTPNASSKIDPSFASTTPGHAAFALRYATEITTFYEGSVSFVNATPTGANTECGGFCMIAHATTTHTITLGGGSSANLGALASLPGNFAKPMPMTGAGPVTFHFKKSIKQVTGENPLMDPGYKCLTNTVPANLVYLIFGYQMLGIAATAISLVVTLKLKIKTHGIDYKDGLLTLSRVSDLSGGKCSACSFLTDRPYQTCCGAKTVCSECGWGRVCTKEFPADTCTREVLLMKMTPPVMVKQTSQKMLTQKQMC